MVVRSSCMFLLVGLITNFRDVLFLRLAGMFPLSLTVNSLSPVEIFMRLVCLKSVIFAKIILLTGSCFIISNPSITCADTLANGAGFVGAGLVGGTVLKGLPVNGLLLLIYHWPHWMLGGA